MNIKKYIVKNCPAYSGSCYEGYTCHYQGSEDMEMWCEDNTDCIIKQTIADNEDLLELFDIEEM